MQGQLAKKNMIFFYFHIYFITFLFYIKQVRLFCATFYWENTQPFQNYLSKGNFFLLSKILSCSVILSKSQQCSVISTLDCCVIFRRRSWTKTFSAMSATKLNCKFCKTEKLICIHSFDHIITTENYNMIFKALKVSLLKLKKKVWLVLMILSTVQIFVQQFTDYI